jgi:hypothetical protein
MDALASSDAKTVARFERRQEQLSKIGYAATAEGQTICEHLLPFLAEFMRDAPKPRALAYAVQHLEAEELALAALAPLLHFVATVDDVEPKDRAREVRLAMGRALHRKLWMADRLTKNKTLQRRIAKARDPKWAGARAGYRQEEWSIEQTLRAGH